MNTTIVPPYRDHLTSSDDLVTTYEAIRAGFVALALEKNRRATPYVAEARALQVAALSAKTPAELPAIRDIENGLLTAAGLSDKSKRHLQPQDKRRNKWLDPRFPRTCGAKVRRRACFQVSFDPWRHTWRFDAQHWRGTGSAKTDASHHFDTVDCGNQVPLARFSNNRVAGPNQRRFRNRVLAERAELARQRPESHPGLQSDYPTGEEQRGPVPV